MADAVNVSYNSKLSSKTVSGVFYRLEIVKRKKIHGLTLVYASKELLELSASKIGVHVSSQNTATTATTSTDPTTKDVANWVIDNKEVQTRPKP